MKRKLATIGSIVLTLVVVLSAVVGCNGGDEPTQTTTSAASEPTLDTASIAAAIDGIKADMEELEAASEVIHVDTDVILEGDAALSDDAAAMTEAVHMSSHAMMLLAIHMNSYIGKLETYGANPEANQANILAVAGKVESLRKVYVESTTTTDFSGWMEWPYTDKAPHDTIHLLMEDADIKATAEYKDAADAMHEAMHTLEEAGGSMRLHLEDLVDLVPAPEPTLDTASIAAAIDGIKADMEELEAASEVIHVDTDVILEGDAALSDDAAAMTEAVHMSSHAMMLLAIHMNSYIGKLETYGANPEANQANILATVGKIESLRKVYVESTTTTDFSGWMEWPYTDKAPHDTIHLLMEDADIKATTEYKDAADAMHEAMHTLEEAGGSMRLHLEDLQDLLN